MNYLKISARNTSSFASIRPFNLVYIVFNWDRPLWRPLAHINDTNLYVNFENSGRAHSWALRPPHLGSLHYNSLPDGHKTLLNAICISAVKVLLDGPLLQYFQIYVYTVNIPVPKKIFKLTLTIMRTFTLPQNWDMLEACHWSWESRESLQWNCHQLQWCPLWYLQV